jgi:AcrR family transcriptional regulator
MPAPLMPKDEVIARIAAVFKAHGYQGSSLAELSEQTGLVKASLYHYFPDGKKGMAEAALDAFGERIALLVIAPLLTDASPRQRLAAMLDGIDEAYSGGDDLCLFALLSIGDARELFQARIAPAIARLIEALVATLRAAGLGKSQATALAEQMVVEVEGALVMARVLGDAGVFQRTLKRLRDRIP